MRLSEKNLEQLSEDEILQLEVEYEKLLSEFKDNQTTNVVCVNI